MPTAQRTLFLYEALDFISNATIFGVCYGIVFTLYCLCTQSLYSQLHKPDQRRQAKFNLGYLSLLLFCATGILALNTRVVQVAYINHANFPGGPFAFENERNPTTGSFDTAASVLDLVIEVLTMAVQVRRRSQCH